MTICYGNAFQRFLLVLTGLCCIELGCYGPTVVAQPAETILSNSMIAKEFWFAIPPTKPWGSGGAPVLEIYVSSFEDTEVTLEVPRIGVIIKKEVRAGEVTTFTSDDNSAQWSWEIDESEKKLDVGIFMHADKPFVANVLTKKIRAVDGFAVIPRRLLGREYTHLSYFDFRGRNGTVLRNVRRGSGFVIVATEDGTNVTYTLDGIGSGETEGGREIGERETIQLQRGQVYMVRGDGQSQRGTFDLSGSTINASKPVGVISFMEQGTVPAAGTSQALGALNEMLPPTAAWGRKFVSLEITGRNSDQRSYYRIIASEDNTGYEALVLNRNSLELESRKTGVLSQAGDVKDFELADPRSDPGAFLNGVVVWTTTHPVLLMQYSFGESSQDARPYMFQVPPTEQTVRNALFQVPAEATGSRLHLFVKGDPEDEEFNLLKSVTLNGQNVSSLFPNFLGSRIPGTDMYFASLQVEPGAYHVKGATGFVGNVYGITTRGGYGFPVAMAVNKTNEFDAIAPRYTTSEECSRIEVKVVDNEQGPADEEPRQIDQGVARVGLIAERSINAELVFITPPETLERFEGINSFSFRLQAIDRQSGAKAVFFALDRAGNLMIDSLDIPPLAEIIELEQSRIDFADVRLGEAPEATMSLTNPTGEAITVNSLRLQESTVFTIIDGPNFPLTLAPNSPVEFRVRYIPVNEDSDGTLPDIDSVLASTDCNDYVLGLVRGRGVASHIRVGSSWNAGTVEIGKQICHTEGLTINNFGTAALQVSDITGIAPPFDISALDPGLPFTVPPGESIQLKGMCFTPEATGDFEITVEFVSDATEPGDAMNEFRSTWAGKGVDPDNPPSDVSDARFPGYILRSSYPNPADGNTTIGFTLAAAGPTQLSLISPLGKQVAVLVDDFLPSGDHSILLDTKLLTPGMYYYRLHSGEFSAAAALIVVR